MKYFFNESENLDTQDSSLSLGWFSINEIFFFKSTYCILTISLADLISELNLLKNEKKNKTVWYPSDSGEKVELIKSKNKIELIYNKNKILFDFQEFEEAVYKASMNLLRELYSNYNQVKIESAFKDLFNYVKENNENFTL
ncbi:hypothetical protein [Flavobacterium inviolabile]|uniref:hypothetical protein n=1 Tax=Flavobacterium inviolabile TaxID=2748320 RepID=UPI0015A8870A|nr:hypothetical protein [Flavobacterium inviolabile]